MKAVRRVKDVENLYLTWISNFSCAPDSFLLHYVRWMMGQKPYLVLEIDSHTADAGLDTRVEAFLDIVESYRRHVTDAAEKPFTRRYSIAAKEQYCDVVDGVRAQGGILVLPHPNPGRLATFPEELLGALDAVEVYNSRHAASDEPDATDPRIEELAGARGLARTGGSDAHFAEEIGLTRTIIPSSTPGKVTEAELRSAIAAGTTRVEGRPSSPVWRMASGMIGLPRNVTQRFRRETP